MSKDTFYFSHDYNARNDIKIKKLISKHGLLGYGIFWALIEELYNNSNLLPTDYETIAFDLRTEQKTVKSVVTEFELFVFKDSFFGSLSVQKRLDERNSKSIKARESANRRWEKYDCNANALQSASDANAIKESKGNKSKGKEIFKAIAFMCLLGYEEKLVSEWFEVRKFKKLKNTETALKAFNDEVIKSGYPINDVLKTCVEKSWGGFKSSWINADKFKPPETGGKLEKALSINQELTEQIKKRYESTNNNG